MMLFPKLNLGGEGGNGDFQGVPSPLPQLWGAPNPKNQSVVEMVPSKRWEVGG